ncbi:hypothetical protein C8F04DRAFT_1060580 [Mycena alexandri]|uniref:Uncharacterized protein n=1 Tax=Mycena alexandri TaxID=1745969 RepID=A0AAD6XH64_9AGAR|nr:hypothetical protein C8F04DRAFT_1060580 [Mycena alexandri]
MSMHKLRPHAAAVKTVTYLFLCLPQRVKLICIYPSGILVMLGPHSWLISLHLTKLVATGNCAFTGLSCVF